MRVEDVPQEGNATLGGQRKGVYAVGADGRIGLVPSRGWAAEELVTTAAVEHFEALAARALARLRAGQGSALEVFMYTRRFDPPTLARTTGIWRWRVRRHLRRPFARLGTSLQRRYAQALDVPAQRLLDLERDPHATAEPGHA
jgi:hypothetical protein